MNKQQALSGEVHDGRCKAGVGELRSASVTVAAMTAAHSAAAVSHARHGCP